MLDAPRVDPVVNHGNVRVRPDEQPAKCEERGDGGEREKVPQAIGANGWTEDHGAAEYRLTRPVSSRTLRAIRSAAPDFNAGYHQGAKIPKVHEGFLDQIHSCIVSS